MYCRFAIAIAVSIAAVAPADAQAPVTFSGKGSDPIEVRDASGEVTEVIRQNNLTLNQMPATGIERNEAARESMLERSQQIGAAKEQAEAEQAARDAEATKAADDDAAKIAAQAAAEEDEYDPTPMKVRRKTVRGTRYIAREPVDPSLRTPENSGLRRIGPPATDVNEPKNAPAWPPARPSQQLPSDPPPPPYDPR